jgi:hypothetical protein
MSKNRTPKPRQLSKLVRSSQVGEANTSSQSAQRFNFLPRQRAGSVDDSSDTENQHPNHQQAGDPSHSPSKGVGLLQKEDSQDMPGFNEAGHSSPRVSLRRPANVDVSPAGGRTKSVGRKEPLLGNAAFSPPNDERGTELEEYSSMERSRRAGGADLETTGDTTTSEDGEEFSTLSLSTLIRHHRRPRSGDEGQGANRSAFLSPTPPSPPRGPPPAPFSPVTISLQSSCWGSSRLRSACK